MHDIKCQFDSRRMVGHREKQWRRVYIKLNQARRERKEREERRGKKGRDVGDQISGSYRVNEAHLFPLICRYPSLR